MDDTAYLAILNRELGPKRVAHCQRVAETAVALAHKNHANERSAYIAGLMHDYAKNSIPVGYWKLLLRPTW